MRIVRDPITLAELTELADQSFGELVKAVVDIDRERPGQGNRTRSVDEPSTRERIVAVVNRLVSP